jgi:hypothetical protein
MNVLLRSENYVIIGTFSSFCNSYSWNFSKNKDAKHGKLG